MATPLCYLPHDIIDNYGGLDVTDSLGPRGGGGGDVNDSLPPPQKKAWELNTAPSAAVETSRAFKK